MNPSISRIAQARDPNNTPAQLGPREAWLELFEDRERGPITNFFLSAVRTGGARSPKTVVTHVLDNLFERVELAFRWDNEDERVKLNSFIDAIQREPELAEGFAEWAIAWCNLPKRERECIKRRRQDHYRNQWMGERSPSDAQLRYLSALGYRGDPPSSMLEASNLIEELKAQQEGARS